ncbi:MAG: hypothetical protein HN348_05455 [Proteobacteria bacterium]|jgi:TrmH family RNA methyltransferase|nr:hypothetical protein [Pseudomonadota bacterium]
MNPAEKLEQEVVIVLVQPQHPGNIGAAARAMKNMGLARLVVVAPPCLDPEQVRWMAPGCNDLLAEMKIVGSLSEALVGVHRIVGTTARHRKQGHPVHTPGQVAKEFFESDDLLAILFGREDFGLSRDDLSFCESLIRIPTPQHASLNLAQAVLLVGHDFFEEARARGGAAEGRMVGGNHGNISTGALSRRKVARDQRAEVQQVNPAADEVVRLLDRVGYMRNTPADKVLLTVRQALQRSAPSVRHVEALRGMLTRVQWALDNPDEDWLAPKKK